MNQYLIIINYYCNTKGYKNHKQVDVLSSPGEADLTADVNFSHLIQIVESQGNHSNHICTLSISLPSSSLSLSLSPSLSLSLSLFQVVLLMVLLVRTSSFTRWGLDRDLTYVAT